MSDVDTKELDRLLQQAFDTASKLYKERGLMAAVISCSALMVVLLFVNIPALVDMFPMSAWNR